MPRPLGRSDPDSINLPEQARLPVFRPGRVVCQLTLLLSSFWPTTIVLADDLRRTSLGLRGTLILPLERYEGDMPFDRMSVGLGFASDLDIRVGIGLRLKFWLVSLDNFYPTRVNHIQGLIPFLASPIGLEWNTSGVNTWAPVIGTGIRMGVGIVDSGAPDVFNTLIYVSLGAATFMSETDEIQFLFIGHHLSMGNGDDDSENGDFLYGGPSFAWRHHFRKRN